MVFARLALVMALAVSVSAQTLTIADIPSCAISPALAAIGTTGCATTDLPCVCKQTTFLSDLSTAIQKVCSQDDYNKAVTVAQALCLQNGVTLSVPGAPPATAAASASSGPVSAATTAASASGSAAVSGSAAASTGSASSAAAASTTSSPSVVVPASNGTTVAASSKAPTATANAAAIKGTWAAAGLLGVGALLAAM